MSKVNECKESNKDLRNFLKANDKYIDSLEGNVAFLQDLTDDLEDVIEEVEEENEELKLRLDGTYRGLKFHVKEKELLSEEIASLKLENILLSEEADHAVMQWELKADDLTDWCKYSRELEKDLESARVEILELKAAASKDFSDAMIAGQDSKDYDSLEDELKQSILRTRKSLVFMEFKKMYKKNPSISNSVVAEALGVSLETIIRLKCIMIAQQQ